MPDRRRQIVAVPADPLLTEAEGQDAYAKGWADAKAVHGDGLREAAQAVSDAWRRVDYVVYSDYEGDEDALLAAGLTLDAPMDALRAALRGDRADARAVHGDGLDAAWAEVEAALPEGWLFHGVSLTDHSANEAYVDEATRSTWGPDWTAGMSWPGHCKYDDCDHDEAFREAVGPTPVEALRSLAAALRGDNP